MCAPLTNVTMVIPSQEEISYLTFMGTMYNSPSPSLRQLADFYINDLNMTRFEVRAISMLRCVWGGNCGASSNSVGHNIRDAYVLRCSNNG
jgi:hypothetical protein